jgi:lipopolysaccharide/colanic/teichoic acid biosynthesis glycosyltransferase
MYKLFFKKILDIIILLLATPILVPILIILSILTWFKLGAPIFFKQERIGEKEKVFSLYKFRSMTNKLDHNGILKPDSERLTSFGAFMRKSSLDELPSIMNVFTGDLSFVGPRPLLVPYLPYYSNREKLRHNVKPGITGLSQVNGRNFLLWDERLEMDVKYVKNISFVLDFQILLKTVVNVIKRKDIAVVPSKLGGRLDIIRKK